MQTASGHQHGGKAAVNLTRNAQTAEVMAGARIEPGDIDGLCVAPAKAAGEVFLCAFEKSRAEKTVRTALEAGMTARHAFTQFGIL